MSNENTKILITGAAGFVGFHLASHLANDVRNELVLVDNLERGRLDTELNALISRDNVHFYEIDLTSPDALRDMADQFDYVYHLAALVGVKNVNRNPDKVLYVNAVATLNLLEWCKGQTALKKILFSSTSEIYSGTLSHFGLPVPTDENVALCVDDITSPRSTYAISKMLGESAFFSYGKQFNIPFTIVRFHNVYGPRMGYAHVIPELMVRMNRENKVDIYSPYHSRAFCYVDDAVKMTTALCEHAGANGEIFHVGNPEEETQIFNLAKMIRNTMNARVKLNEGPVTPGSPERRCPSIEKLVKLTGVHPEIDLKSGLQKTYNWYKNKLDDQFE